VRGVGYYAGFPGGEPGAGGGGGWNNDGSGNPSYNAGGGGGAGAYLKKTYGAGLLVPGTLLAIGVGAGGTAGTTEGYRGGVGAAGRMTITWT
jgi:hypothetical protein